MDPNPAGESVYYKLTALDHAGNESVPAAASVTVGVPPASLPDWFALHPVAPNPVRDHAVLRYDVPAAGGQVRLEIFDVAGRRVRGLVEGPAAPGAQTVSWDGRDDRGRAVRAGVYLCRMRAPGFTRVRKLMIAR
jgi:hypothetical protein